MGVALLSFEGRVRMACNRGQRGSNIESLNERNANTRTSMDCIESGPGSSVTVGEEGRLVLGVRANCCIGFSVCKGKNTY